MHLEHDFLEVMSALNHQSADHLRPQSDKIISVIDYTLLDPQADAKTLMHFQSTLNQYPVAAVCTTSDMLKQLSIPDSVLKATVVNFPKGLQSVDDVCHEIDEIADAVDEIDYVFPQKYDGQAEEKQALLHCKKAYEHCKQHQLTFKVILETGAINHVETMLALSLKIIAQGCDFLKTSTGKTPIGATPLAAFTLLKAIELSGRHSDCGLKVSGGIKQPEQAWLYLMLAEHCLKKTASKDWFRIGASSLLDAF